MFRRSQTTNRASFGCLVLLQTGVSTTEAPQPCRPGGRLTRHSKSGRLRWHSTLGRQRTMSRLAARVGEDPRLFPFCFALELVLHAPSQVTKVGPLGGSSPSEVEDWKARHDLAMSRPGSLPPHRYAMFLECFTWAINNNADGNLTYGWVLLNGTHAPPGAPCGGPSMRYSPLDGGGGDTIMAIAH